MLKENDFLLPSLLDRLTDLEPKRKTDTYFSYKVMNVNSYRQSVFRDILFLLNTIAFDNSYDLILPAQVQQSTLNYGIPAFSGNKLSDINWDEIENNILNCLKYFEPRLSPDTLKVNILVNENSFNHILILEIRGDLKMNPYPQEFLLKTSMDVESGTFNLVEI